MATFGQKIPQHLIELPRRGFFNFHHSGPTWPSYPGPDPIAAMQRDGLKHLVLTMHPLPRDDTACTQALLRQNSVRAHSLD
jgi:methionyl-tRNA formyltransferase